MWLEKSYLPVIILNMFKETALAKVLKALIYSTAFVPLIIFSQYMSPFHFGKVVIFRSIVELMFVVYLLLVWKDRSYLPRMSKIVWSFFFFTLAFSLATITSVQVYQSFWGTHERMGGLWTFWHYFVYFIILISVFRKRDDWLNFFKVIVVVGTLSAFYGFGQKTDIKFFIGSGNRSRIFGTIGNAALFAGYQLLILFLSLTLYFRPANTVIEKRLYCFAAVMTSIAVMMTAVRGSILALGVGLLIFTLLHTIVGKSVFAKKAFLSLVVLVFLFIGFSFVFKDSSFVKNSGYLTRITNLSFKNFTVQTRFWAWEAGINGWKDSFKTIFFGWGPENFNIPFSKNFNPKFFTGLGSETLFDRAHNMFVEILVTMGLVGFMAYVSVFGVALRKLWLKAKEKNKDSSYAVGLFSLIVAYMVHNSFIFDTSANFLVFFTILGFVSFVFFEGEQNIESFSEKTKNVNSKLYSIVSVVLVLSVVVLIYKTNVLPSKANFATTRAIIKGWENDFNGSIKKYKEAVSYDVPGKYEIRQRLAQHVLEVGTKITKSTPEITEGLKFAISEVKKNADENPLDYLPRLYLSRLNILLGKNDPRSPYNDEALKYALEAFKLSPTFVRTNYEIGQVYLNKGDLVKASEYFKKAADLNPDVGLSYWYWGMVELERGNTNLGIELVNKAIEKGFSGSESDYARLVSVYLKIGDYKHLSWVYEKLISIKPNNAQYRASLAVAYSKTGEIDKAVAQAREAARLDPSFAAEAKSFVNGLGREF